MRRHLIIALAVPLALIASACGSDSNSKSDSTSAPTAGNGTTAEPAITTAASTQPIVIGVASSLTGPLSFYDGEILNGMKIAVDEVNASGGVGGRQLSIVTADNSNILGTGLGLYLARELARMQGGEITVSSREGAGSDFTISLPLAGERLGGSVRSLAGPA